MPKNKLGRYYEVKYKKDSKSRVEKWYILTTNSKEARNIASKRLSSEGKIVSIKIKPIGW